MPPVSAMMGGFGKFVFPAPAIGKAGGRENLVAREREGMAKRKKNPVDVYQLVCGSCQSRNYVASLKKENKSLEVSKFCPHERKHTPHKAKKA
ncbi:MAG: 50S ribosomal protein L33 [Planctomycetota bacterium]|jgi:ribosomal protein L33|nr:50S ribosomal protein L33 [Planctomycetota bacterium]